MANGWICVQYTEGHRDYIMVEFHVNGIPPKGGYKMVFSEDGQTVTFQHAIHKLLFAKEHLKLIMMPNGEYSNTYTLVVAVDDNAQLMRKERVEESDEVYWGTAQVVNLKVKCTGSPEFGYKEYPTGYSVGKHKQFNCVCTCKVQVWEQ